MTSSGGLIRNIFSNWSNLAVSTIVGFAIMPFVVASLGDIKYGIWTLVVSLVGYGNLLDLGVRSSIVRYSARALATDDRDGLQRLFGTTLSLYSSIAVVIVGLAGLVSAYLHELFRIPAEFGADARLVVLIAGLSLALKFPGGVFEGFLLGSQRYVLVNGVSIGCTLVRALATVAVLVTGKGLIGLALIGLATDLATIAVMVVVTLRRFPWLRLRRHHLSREVLRDVYAFGLWSFAIALASRILYESDAILIGSFLSAAAITHFAIANSLVRYLRQVAYGLGNVFTPASSHLQATGQREALGRLLLEGSHYGMTILLPGALLLAGFGREFISLWMGPAYSGETGDVLIILVLSQVAAMAQFPAGAVLYGVNRHRFLAFVLLGEACIKLALSVVLAPRFGIIGIAIATAVPELIASFGLIPVLASRAAGVPLIRYLRYVFVGPLLCSLPTAMLVIWITAVAPPHSWPTLVRDVAAALLLYVVFALRWCVGSSERIALIGAVRRKFGWSTD